MNVGVIGLGSLGSTVVEGLVGCGLTPVGCDKVPKPENSNSSIDILPRVDSPAAVAQMSDVVFVSVFDEDQVRDVLTGTGGILESRRRPLHVVVLSTVSLDFLRWCDEQLTRHNIGLVDCGVNGAPGIRTGQMVASVGGSESAVAAVRPVLEHIANPILHLGPLGARMAGKLIRNLVQFAVWYAGWQGAMLAVTAGIDVANLVKVVDASEGWTYGSMFLVRQTLTAGEPPTGITAYAHKDMGAALDLAEQLGLPLPIMSQIEQDYETVARGLGTAPIP